MKCTQSRNPKLDELEKAYYQRLLQDFPHQNPQTQQSIIRWLLRELEHSDRLTPNQLKMTEARIDYRYRILQQRYLEATPSQAYCNLMNRLGSLVMLHTKAAHRQDRQRVIAQILQKVLQEILGDRVIRQQMNWIAQCTQERNLQNALLLSSLEEYCLQSVGNQPLVIYKFFS